MAGLYTAPTVRKPIISGTVFVILALAIGGCAASEETDRDEHGQVTEKSKLSVFDLRVGDCLVNVRSETGEQRDIEAVPCSEPHDGEVYTNIDLGDGAFPGERFLIGKAERGCPARLRRQAPKSRDDISYFTPTERSWKEEDDHQVTCLLEYTTKHAGTVAAQSDGR